MKFHKRKHREMLTNGDILTEVEFFISEDAVVSYLKDEKIQLRDTTVKELYNRIYALRSREKELSAVEYKWAANYFFQSKLFLNFIELLKKSFSRIAKEYKGFPSSLHKTKNIEVEFIEGGAASISHPKNDFSKLVLWLNVLLITDAPEKMVSLLTHELYHVVSACHENEEELITAFEQISREVEGKAQRNQKELEEHITHFEAYLESEEFIHLNYQLVRHRVQSFYELISKSFWNRIADMALNIIAIELKDLAYLDEALANEAYWLNICSKTMSEFPLIRKRVLQDAPKEEQSFLMEVLRFLQFTTAYNYVPLYAIPIAVLGEDYTKKKRNRFFTLLGNKRQREAKKILNEYSQMIERFCDKEVVKDYLSCYEQLHNIVEKGKVHYDQFSGETTQPVHNAVWIKQAKSAHAELITIENKYVNRIRNYLHEMERVKRAA